MNEIKIRKALLGDLEQLLVFEQDLIKTERPFDLTLKPDPINYYDLESLLTSPRAEVVVAETDNKVIASGYARIDKSKSFLKHNTHAYLGFMYVKPEFRGQGVNLKILQSLIEWAKEKTYQKFALKFIMKMK